MWKVSPSDKAEKPAEEGQLITRADKMKLLLASEKKKYSMFWKSQHRRAEFQGR